MWLHFSLDEECNQIREFLKSINVILLGLFESLSNEDTVYHIQTNYQFPIEMLVEHISSK